MPDLWNYCTKNDDDDYDRGGCDDDDDDDEGNDKNAWGLTLSVHHISLQIPWLMSASLKRLSSHGYRYNQSCENNA